MGLCAATTAAGSPAGSWSRLPLRFEPNLGQSEPRVLFLARGSGYGLYLTAEEAVMVLRRGERVSYDAALLRLRLVGGGRHPEAVGVGKLPGRSHYFLGSDPGAWRTDVPQYAGVEFRAVYPGVDLTYYGKEGQIEYDFVVASGADPRRIRFRIEGARHVRLDTDGNLVLSAEGGEVIHRAPVFYQEVDGERRSVMGRYVLHGRRDVSFEVGKYDRTRPLVIDPVLSYATYLGGTGSDLGTGVAVDSSGNAYLTGITASTNFPTASPRQGYAGGYEAFVAKLAPSGSTLVYSTYLGGSGNDRGLGVAVDSSGNAYVTGDTASTNFPTTSPVQAANAGGYDAFVAKLDPSGSALLYSTYLGGSGTDGGEGIAVDPAGSAYVTGETTSTNFRTAYPLQASYGGGTDGFVAKLDPSGSALVYSTYLGGASQDYGMRVAADASGHGYVTGWTSSTDFPTANALQPGKAGGNDAFVARLEPSGSALAYSTYLGGSSDDFGRGVAVDPAGNAYVAGYTYSTNFPAVNPLQASLAGVDDVFVTKISPSGSALTYSTYLGGSAFDAPFAIAVDSAGSAYVAGATGSANFPTADPLQASHAGNEDAFVTKLTPSGSALAYSTYLGGSGYDDGYSIAVDSSGSATVAGRTSSTDFPTASPLQPGNAGSDDVFIVRIATPSTGTSFYTVTPCRLLDTRGPDGTYGGPPLVAGTSRSFPLASQCGIPATARAVSVNLTVTEPTTVGHLRLYRAGAPLPTISSLNYSAGQTRGNNAVVALNELGELAAYCAQASGTAQLVLDVNGYFE
jgi:hypothetical protein